MICEAVDGLTGAVCNRQRMHRPLDEHRQKTADFEILWTDIPALLLPEDYDLEDEFIL